MKGITESMKGQMSGVLAMGMAEGRGPYDIAYKLKDRVEAIGITRARLIARTEVVHTHNAAAMNEFESLEGIVGETIYVQWWTALDERVRATHAARHGKVFKRKTAQGLIGEPNCRCALLPWTKTLAKARKGTLKVPEKWGAESFASFKDTFQKKYGMEADVFGTMPDTEAFNVVAESVEQAFSALPVEAQEAFRDLKIKIALTGDDVIKTKVGDASGLFDFDYRDGSATLSLATKGRKLTEEGLRLGQQSLSRSAPDFLLKEANTILPVTVRHEIGHWYLENFLRVTDYSKYRSLSYEWNEMYDILRGMERAERVSDIIMVNELEAFAESFALWTSPQYGKEGLTLPGGVDDFFRKILPK